MRPLQAGRRLGAVVAALLFACAAPAGASYTIVPDQTPTIQAAVDGSADTIWVHDGEYTEDVAIARPLVLLSYPRQTGSVLGYEYPCVRSLSITTSEGAVLVIGFHVRGPVGFLSTGAGQPAVTFEGCRIDAGFSAGGSNHFASVRLRGNVVMGGVTIASLYWPSVVGNAVIGGGVSVSGNGSVVVEGNFIEGPGNVGLTLCCSDGEPLAYDNVVRGFSIGVRAGDRGKVVKNRITNCSDSGIELTGSTPVTISAIDNVVRACGGYGIRAYGGGSPFVFENTVDSTGQAGIRCEGGLGVPAIVRNNTVRYSLSHGIWVSGGIAVSSNVVLHASADGIHTATDDADSNVVGRCGAGGIVASGSAVRQNTSYLNLGAGLVLTGGSGTAVDHNIAFGNGATGVDANAVPSAVLGCNDWYSNTGGATGGVAPGATDLSIDPQFCDVTGDNVTLAATSPVLTATGCGRIGARGLGCTSPTSVEPAPGDGRSLSASPVPARSVVRLSWVAGAAASRIEVFDLQGARRFHADLPAGISEFHWSAVDDSGLLVPSGVYFVRRTPAAGRVEATRIVIQR